MKFNTKTSPLIQLLPEYIQFLQKLELFQRLLTLQTLLLFYILFHFLLSDLKALLSIAIQAIAGAVFLPMGSNKNFEF
jgi:uncharacterized membrane protein (DUF485 family)